MRPLNAERELAQARQEMSEVRVLTDTPWVSAVERYWACGFVELGDDGIDTHFRMELQLTD